MNDKLAPPNPGKSSTRNCKRGANRGEGDEFSMIRVKKALL